MAQIEPTVCINNLGLNLLWNCLNLALSLAGAKENKEKPISTKSIKADQKYLRMQKKNLEKSIWTLSDENQWRQSTILFE